MNKLNGKIMPPPTQSGERGNLFMEESLNIRIVLGKLISHNPTIHMEILMFASQKTKTKHRKIGNHRLDNKESSVPGGRH